MDKHVVLREIVCNWPWSRNWTSYLLWVCSLYFTSLIVIFLPLLYMLGPDLWLAFSASDKKQKQKKTIVIIIRWLYHDSVYQERNSGTCQAFKLLHTWTWCTAIFEIHRLDEYWSTIIHAHMYTLSINNWIHWNVQGFIACSHWHTPSILVLFATQTPIDRSHPELWMYSFS